MILIEPRNKITEDKKKSDKSEKSPAKSVEKKDTESKSGTVFL